MVRPLHITEAGGQGCVAWSAQVDKDQRRLLAACGAPAILYRGAPFFRSFELHAPKRGFSMQTQQVQQVMTMSVYSCHVNDHLGTAAKLMWEHDCGVVPVVNDDGRAIGMLTDRDICMAAFTQGRVLDGAWRPTSHVAASGGMPSRRQRRSGRGADERASAPQTPGGKSGRTAGRNAVDQ
jgi:CBS domain-containing protein